MLILALLILVALAFDFMNGFHDAANSIATVVSTRVLTPRAAVAWAAFFNFVAAFGFGVAVATTVGKGIVAPEVVDRAVIFAALVAAFLWDLITCATGSHRAPRTRSSRASPAPGSRRPASGCCCRRGW